MDRSLPTAVTAGGGGGDGDGALVVTARPPSPRGRAATDWSDASRALRAAAVNAVPERTTLIVNSQYESVGGSGAVAVAAAGRGAATGAEDEYMTVSDPIGLEVDADGGSTDMEATFPQPGNNKNATTAAGVEESLELYC